MKKHKFAIILLIIGTILVVMGLSLTIYNYMNNKNNENKETEANILNNTRDLSEIVKNFMILEVKLTTMK